MAAALLSFAFLPVAYSRVAVTDVGALAGVALALLWAVRAADGGRSRDYALAGAAAGLAISFKYTAGLVLLPLGIAALARLRADGLRAVGGLVLGGALAALVFVLLNPYLFGSTSGGPTSATRPTSPPTTASRARRRAGSATTSTASPGGSAGPPSRRRSWGPSSCCAATSCAG